MKNKTNKLILEIKKKSLIVLDSPEATHGLKRSLRGLLKEINLFSNHIRTSKKRIKVKDTCVQIGSGKHYLKNFLNIDVVPLADIIWDIREGIPLKSTTVEFIFSEHFLEHIDYPFSVKKFIKECYRVLKKNGQVVIGVPDGALAIQAYCRKDKKLIGDFMRKWYSKRNFLSHFNTPIDFLNYHFRDQDDNKKYNPHFWSYDYEKIKYLLKKAKFSKIKRWKFDKKIANSARKFGTIYVTAIK